MNENHAGFLIKQIHTSLEKSSNKALAADGLTFSQIGLLLELEKAPEHVLTFKALEKKLGLAQSTTVGLISRLGKKAMLQTCTDPADARIKYAVLTQEGMKCCAKAEKSMQQEEKILLADLNEQEQKQFIDYLRRVNHSLQEKQMGKTREAALVNKGIRDYEEGRLTDGSRTLAELRSKHGFSR